MRDTGNMNRLKRAIASFLVAFGITVGAVVVAPVATAAPAHAYTTYNCYSYYQYGYKYTRACYYDYNWWEELNGHRDGWYNATVYHT